MCREVEKMLRQKQKRKCKYIAKQKDYRVFNIHRRVYCIECYYRAQKFSEIQKRRCKYSSVGADRIEQVGIFTLLSRTGAIGSVTFV